MKALYRPITTPHAISRMIESETLSKIADDRPKQQQQRGFDPKSTSLQAHDRR